MNLFHFPLLVIFHLHKQEISCLKCKPFTLFNSILELVVVFLSFFLHLFQKTVVVIGSAVFIIQVELLIYYV